MTNRIALILGLIIVGAIIWDLQTQDGATLLFLLRHFADLIEWIKFWR